MLKFCSEGTKLYGNECLEESFWNELTYSVNDPKVAGMISLVLIFFLWLVFFKRYAFRKAVALWKKIVAFTLLLIVSLIILFVTILFGQLIGINLL
jgi:hypothetical protein